MQRKLKETEKEKRIWKVESFNKLERSHFYHKKLDKKTPKVFASLGVWPLFREKAFLRPLGDKSFDK